MRKSIIVFLSLCLFSCRQEDRSAIKTGFEGKPLPSFNLLLSDSITSLNNLDIPKGQPIVLLFFSPNCPYCRAEISDIIRNISNMSTVRFYLFTNSPFRNFKSFYEHYQIGRYKNIIAGQDSANFFARHFRAVGVPFTTVYSKDKILEKAFVGRLKSWQIKDVAGIK